MKILHVLKSEPEESTSRLIDMVSEGAEVTVFPLYQGEPDYDSLVELLFEHDQVITWW